MPGPSSGSPESHSPEPWGQDRKDVRTVLDAQARLVAVTTMSGDAERIVAGVNATRGLALPGLAVAPLLDAFQILYEICQYNSDTRFRNFVDRRGGFEALLARANAAWRAFGEESFKKEGPGREPAVTPGT
jgi:hypothetical protein